MLQRKLFLGARLKRLRRERGLNQSQMADVLGISASYLNHLERNQRPVTAGILLLGMFIYIATPLTLWLDERAAAKEARSKGGGMRAKTA